MIASGADRRDCREREERQQSSLRAPRGLEERIALVREHPAHDGAVPSRAAADDGAAQSVVIVRFALSNRTRRPVS